MKAYLSSLFGLFALAATAQTTYVNYPVTHFTQASPNFYQGITNIVVGTNVIAKVVAIQTSGGITTVDLTIQNPGLPLATETWPTTGVLNTPFLGPCTITVTATSITASNTVCQYTVQFDAVNGTATLGGLVQPAGFLALIQLQTSTDLMNWETITNAPFSKSESNRFFRTSLFIP